MGPERAYENFIAHCESCRRCTRAGGEWADPQDLCSIGKTLQEVWAKLEKLESIKEEHHVARIK